MTNFSEKYLESSNKIKEERAQKTQQLELSRNYISKKELEDVMFLEENMDYLKEQLSNIKMSKRRSELLWICSHKYNYEIELTPTIKKILNKNLILDKAVFNLIEGLIFWISLFFALNGVNFVFDDVSNSAKVMMCLFVIVVYLCYDIKKK